MDLGPPGYLMADTPTFCRHNRLLQNCPICSREQDVEMRPVVSSGTPATARGVGAPARSSSGPSRTPGRSARTARAPGLRVRRLERSADDGYRSPLAPGLRSQADAERLAAELAFAATRLERLACAPPGLYAEVADPGSDVEERAWLAFLIAYLCPLDGEAPFSAIREIRTSWASGAQPALDGVPTGPRTAHEPTRGARTLEAYRAWAGRAGTQARAFGGEPEWTPERRFARAFERLALPGFHRDARFDLLVTLGCLGVFELRAGTLALGGSDEVTLAAKRVLGIGDAMLLERRAEQLAEGCGVSLAALDLGLFNWGRPPDERATLGLGPAAEANSAAVDAARAALSVA
jgi:hypothetical protein